MNWKTYSQSLLRRTGATRAADHSVQKSTPLDKQIADAESFPLWLLRFGQRADHVRSWTN
jgi:hypothetical protein